MKLRRDLFLILTVVFAFAALMLFLAGVVLNLAFAQGGFRGFGQEIIRSPASVLPPVVDVLLALIAVVCYRQYKRCL